MLVSWLHLAAFVLYLGCLIALWIIVLPTVPDPGESQARAHLLARKLKLYNPLQTAALGVMVLSGAFQLTDLKAVYRETFSNQLGTILAIKLSLAFVLIVLGIHQTMGIGLPFVRRCDGGEPISSQDVTKVVRRLRYSVLPLFVLTLLTGYTGLRMRGF